MPPGALSVIGLPAERLKLLVNCSVPPLKVNGPRPRPGCCRHQRRPAGIEKGTPAIGVGAGQRQDTRAILGDGASAGDRAPVGAVGWLNKIDQPIVGYCWRQRARRPLQDAGWVDKHAAGKSAIVAAEDQSALGDLDGQTAGQGRCQGPGSGIDLREGLKVQERIRCGARALQRYGIRTRAAVRRADDGRAGLQHQRVIAVTHRDRRADIALHETRVDDRGVAVKRADSDPALADDLPAREILDRRREARTHRIGKHRIGTGAGDDDLAGIDQLIVVALKETRVARGPCGRQGPAVVDGATAAEDRRRPRVASEVDTVPVLINALLSCPVLVCPHAAVIPYALGPAVAIEPLLMSLLLLPLAAMPSLKAPVVLIVAPAALVSVLPLVLPSIAAPRLVPLPAPPLSDSVPLLVMALFWSTLRMGNGTAMPCEALTDAPGTTLIVTPVLPATATTGVVLLPEHVTVIPLVGAVLLHWAVADDVEDASNNTGMIALAAPLAIAPTVFCPPEAAVWQFDNPKVAPIELVTPRNQIIALTCLDDCGFLATVRCNLASDHEV